MYPHRFKKVLDIFEFVGIILCLSFEKYPLFPDIHQDKHRGRLSEQKWGAIDKIYNPKIFLDNQTIANGVAYFYERR